MEQLIQWDQELLLAINGWHSVWADQLMWYVSTKWLWIPLYVLLAGLLMWRFGWKRGLVYVAAIGICVGLSDYISSGILKPWIERWRPSRDPELKIYIQLVNGYRGGKYGFPSSHAANTMAVGWLFCLLWSRPICAGSQDRCQQQRNHLVWWLLMPWVAIVCYSRMYLGVHYPLDILAGLTLGALLAWGLYAALKAWEHSGRWGASYLQRKACDASTHPSAGS